MAGVGGAVCTGWLGVRGLLGASLAGLHPGLGFRLSPDVIQARLSQGTEQPSSQHELA